MAKWGDVAKSVAVFVGVYGSCFLIGAISSLKAYRDGYGDGRCSGLREATYIVEAVKSKSKEEETE